MQTTEQASLIFATSEGIVGALMALYYKGTFLPEVDGILISFAKQYAKHGRLSEKQQAIAKARLFRYSKLIEEMKPEALPIIIYKSDEGGMWVDYDNGLLKLHFNYDKQVIQLMRQLEGSFYDSNHRTWCCHPTFGNMETAVKIGFKIRTSATSIWYNTFFQEEIPASEKMKIKVNGTLRPFQEQGVDFIESRNGRALIADEMGLGKTIQALAWVYARNIKNTLVICPATIKLNWEREINKWCPEMQVTQVKGMKPEKQLFPITDRQHVFVMNYEIAKAWLEMFRGEHALDCLILDESQYAKNRTAKRTKAVIELAKRCRHVIALTGTPVVNRPIEMYTSIRMIDPKLFPSYWGFVQRYCNPKHNGFGWDVSGASNVGELHDKLKASIMLRRTKTEVLSELPKKQRIVIPIEMTRKGRKDYMRMESVLQDYLEAKETAGMDVLAQMEGLKQLAVIDKLPSVIDWIHSYLETERKLVVFCTHVESPPILKQLMEELKAYKPVTIHGSVSQINRQKAIDTFQTEPDCRLFIGQLKAAGIGITLTAANATAFVELGWTPADHDQAEDRVHRIGQQADSVTAYYLLAENTIEEDIAKLIDKKRKVIDAIVDGHETDDTALLAELFNMYKGKH